MEFKREKVSSLLGHTEVFFIEKSTEGMDQDFRLVADAAGIRFQGKSPTLASVDDLEVFAQAVSSAWTDHQDLRKYLQTRLMGGH